MCIIFYNERGTEYNPNEVSNAWFANDDGVGLMWVDNGEVKVIRDLMSREDTVKLALAMTGIPHVLHLRYGTHGPTNRELCHPFRVTPVEAAETVWMAHNGVMTDEECGGSPGPDESDTSVLARTLQAKSQSLGSDIFFNEGFLRDLESRIDPYNKIIFLGSSGRVGIVHPGSWHTDDDTGIWYSNRYSIAPKWKSAELELEELKATAKDYERIFSAYWADGDDIDWFGEKE
jgi:hypothetical protein